MPIFEYRCVECGKTTEYFVMSGKGEPEIVCKKCGSEELTRVLSGFTSSSRSSTQNSDECCGVQNPCSDPKRCCERS